MNTIPIKNVIPTKLIWVDLEMTGLDSRVNRIVEVAVIITDFKFNELATYSSIVHQPEEVLSASNDFCLQLFESNGFYDEVRRSPVSEQGAQRELCALIDAHVPIGERFLAGNSVHKDREFIDAQWTDLSDTLHYRMLDVTSFKLWWLGTGRSEFKKSETHRALDDIRESIAELKYYISELHTN